MEVNIGTNGGLVHRVYFSILPRLLLSGHQAVAIENAALRLQLACSVGNVSDRS